MKIADVMTRGVVSVAPDESMRDAALLMLQYDVSGFPVVDRGKLVGMVTEGDFLSRVETGTEPGETRRIDIAAHTPRKADLAAPKGRLVPHHRPSALDAEEADDASRAVDLCRR